MGLNARKPVFGVSDQVRLMPAWLATETDQTAQIRRLVSTLVVACNKVRFSGVEAHIIDLITMTLCVSQERA